MKSSIKSQGGKSMVEMSNRDERGTVLSASCRYMLQLSTLEARPCPDIRRLVQLSKRLILLYLAAGVTERSGFQEMVVLIWVDLCPILLTNLSVCNCISGSHAQGRSSASCILNRDAV